MESEEEKDDIRVDAVSISLQEKIDSLPAEPGCYQFIAADGSVLYVGKAKTLRSRVRQYFQSSRSVHPRTAAMIGKIADLQIITTTSEVEALILEATLIKELKPKYNVDLKDDKSYPYIVITSEPYPRVFVTRRVIRDGSRYFGPYTDVNTMRAALKTVRTIFMIRSCNFRIDDEFIQAKKTRVCLDYHIKKCEGPCEGLVSQKRYTEMIEEAALILSGKILPLQERLQIQMDGAAERLAFEEAAAARDRLRELDVYSRKQSVVDSQLHDRDVFAVAVDGDDACGVLLKIREGKVMGRHHYYLSKAEGKPESDLLRVILQRYYWEDAEIPHEVVVSAALDDGDALAAWLSQKKGTGMNIIIPIDGEMGRVSVMCRKNAEYLLGELKLQRLKRGDFVPAALTSLQRELRLKNPPRRIECFDISHIQGSETAASMVVFVDGKPKKSEYRKYKIREGEEGKVIDDYGSMKEVIHRRYARLAGEHSSFPDLILIDGGKGQLSSVSSVLEELGCPDQPVISLAKRLEEVFVPNESDPLFIPKTSASLRLLQQLRDEAHRFAVTFHRSLRAKRTLQTELDVIEGVGKKRAKALLQTFGSVQGVKLASEEQLTEVVGSKTAVQICNYFSDERPLA